MTLKQLTCQSIETLNKIIDSKKAKRTPPCLILLNGRRVILPSGKSVWGRKSDAINAIRNFVKDEWHSHGMPEEFSQKDLYDEVVKKLEVVELSL